MSLVSSLRSVAARAVAASADAAAAMVASVVAGVVSAQLARTSAQPEPSGVPIPVHCDVCNLTRERITVEEVRALVVDCELPCCPGGAQVLIDPEAVSEAMGMGVAA